MSPLRVREATAADVDTIAQIHRDAFGPHVMSRLMYPDGLNPAIMAKLASGFSFDGQKSLDRLLVVAELLESADAEKGDVVAFAKWQILRHPRPESEWKAAEPEALPEGVNRKVMDAFLGGMHRMRDGWVKGDPAMILSILACTPTRARLGAGSVLLRHGLEIADKYGLTTWLESTPAGYPLYRRHGFQDVDILDLPIASWGATHPDGEDWGANCAVSLGPLPDGHYRSILMRREKKQENK